MPHECRAVTLGERYPSVEKIIRADRWEARLPAARPVRLLDTCEVYVRHVVMQANHRRLSDGSFERGTGRVRTRRSRQVDRFVGATSAARREKRQQRSSRCHGSQKRAPCDAPAHSHPDFMPYGTEIRTAST